MKHLRWILVGSVFFWTLPAWAQATATTGQIEGTITDESKGALPGVTVTVRDDLQTCFIVKASAIKQDSTGSACCRSARTS